MTSSRRRLGLANPFLLLILPIIPISVYYVFLSEESTLLKNSEGVRKRESDNVTGIEKHASQPHHADVTDDTESCLLQPHCIRQRAAEWARPWADRPNSTWLARFPNYESLLEHSRIKAKEYENGKGKVPCGLLYVKVPKTASSTIAGVALRISRRHNATVRYQHALAWEENYGNRDKEKSYLFASIRDPAERILSSLSFRASVKERPLSESDILQSLKFNSEELPQSYVPVAGRGGLQVVYVSLSSIPKYSVWNPQHPSSVQMPERVHQLVHDIVDSYDFLLVSERLEESLVAMSILMRIPISDILVLSTKVANRSNKDEADEVVGDVNWYLVPGRNQKSPPKCVQLHSIRKPLAPSIQQYFESEEWRAKVYVDLLLHEVAQQSLNLTIQVIGQRRFEGALATYRQLSTKASEICRFDNHKVQFQCSPDGHPQEQIAQQFCYDDDMGCGHVCIDEMLLSSQYDEHVNEEEQRQDNFNEDDY